jgi:hypothetical protein
MTSNFNIILVLQGGKLLGGQKSPLALPPGGKVEITARSAILLFCAQSLKTY